MNCDEKNITRVLRSVFGYKDFKNDVQRQATIAVTEVLLKKRKILSYVVFDEAHCLSKWGYEYISSYKKISLFNKIYGYVPRIAVTTTVTDKVVEDICKVLTLTTPKVFRMSVQQIRVHCDVWFLDTLSNPFEHLKRFIAKVLCFVDTFPCKMHEGYAIVYCREEVTAELIKKKLSDLGIYTLTYHHRLKDGVRRNIENMWMTGNAQVITTTRDYGFIHEKPIRCIAYWTIPENIPKYYRECAQMYTNSGRPYSRIYFSVREYSSVRSVLKNHREINEPEFIKNCLSEYDKLVSYCLSINCRHKNIHKYFGHVIPPCKVKCDVCKNKTVVEARTHKFITRSEQVDRVTYNICKINEDLKNKRTRENDKEKPESTSKSEFEKEIPMTRHKLPKIEEKPLPDESSSLGMQLSIPVGELAITQSLADKYNLNKETISLELCSTKNSTFKDSERGANNNPTCSNGRGLAVGSRIRHANDDGKIKKSEKCRVSKSDSREVIVVFEKLRKRSLAVDTWPEEFKSKRRKLETENKPSNETRINRNEGADDRNRRRVERIKGDANEGVTCDLAAADYLMNKYKLNKDSITLESRRK
ncbi:uncharacterized protein LOC143373642 isoform X3 [Andrena cerasifolii]|uniref:uncharacterized protein LOC143373642 isoform X3 n=1 Tax=Andrena cerasifolii TaxID=2819439 RepID=UPI0040382393